MQTALQAHQKQQTTHVHSVFRSTHTEL